jgi:anti-sigma factor RsiW
MNAERIERLAMDRSLGELNEDAAVLFDTYLAEHPEVQALAQSMSETCAQTRRAIDSKTREESAVHHVAGTRCPWSRWIHWARFGRWAAVVAVSVGIGVTIGQWSRPQVPAQDSQVVQAEPAGSPDDWQPVLSSQRQGFWQNKALALLQTRPYESSGSHEQQTSLWGRYKRLRKEPSHE